MLKYQHSAVHVHLHVRTPVFSVRTSDGDDVNESLHVLGVDVTEVAAVAVRPAEVGLRGVTTSAKQVAAVEHARSARAPRQRHARRADAARSVGARLNDGTTQVST